MTATRQPLWKTAAVAAAGAILVLGVGGLATDIGPWYRALRKPDWTPPDWLFGPAWTLIFALTAAAGVIAWRRGRSRSDRLGLLGLFALNGMLNIAWSVLFFRLRRPDWALLEVALLWLSVLLLIVLLRRLSRTASALLLPYLAWVGFAGYLNYVVVRMNPPF